MEYAKTFSKGLELYVKDNNGRTGASKMAETDIQSVSISSFGPLEKGKMYAFEYYASSVNFFDSYPIVIGLGRSDSGHQLGLNLHWIPYNFRVSFLKDLTTSLQSEISQQLKGRKMGNPRLQSPINYLTWENLKDTYQRKYNLKNGIRQYITNNMRKVKSIGYENWYLGAVHNENYFIGGTIGQAQSLYYKNI
tara:strand:- start:19950 stop:20528 length:579 start_codon:yes stop_codon:yes gene_type:complete